VLVGLSVRPLELLTRLLELLLDVLPLFEPPLLGVGAGVLLPPLLLLPELMLPPLALGLTVALGAVLLFADGLFSGWVAG
jgi:ABC-type cobalamin transport system permease subunit